MEIYWGLFHWLYYYVCESFSIFNVVGMSHILTDCFNEFSKVEVRSKVYFNPGSVQWCWEGGCKNSKWVQPAEVIMRSSNNCDTLQQPFSWVFKQHCFHGHLNTVIINCQRSKTKNVSIGGLQSNSIFHVFLLSSAYPRLLSIHWLNYWLPKIINLHSKG